MACIVFEKIMLKIFILKIVMETPVTDHLHKIFILHRKPSFLLRYYWKLI